MSSNINHLETIFFAALNIHDPEARSDYLAQACEQDAALQKQVEQMLSLQSKVGSFMEQPPAAYAGTVNLEAKILEAGLSAGIGPGEAVVVGSANHSVLRSLGLTLGEVPRVLLRDPKENGKDPIVRPRSNEVPAEQVDSRYQLAGEIARGGMGAIIKGRDIDLGRDLAIKVLLDAHKDKPEVVQRFIEEAQIGGQLQHPGIVPVYELGQFGDQRPFFSMKLVKGETLAGLLSARKSPTEDRAKYLGIFEQICQTMAYAHSRGVIHRDLKPANVMVGAFGEVQVMDWGLAKVLASGGIADEKKSLAKQTDVSVIQTRRSLGSESPGSIGSQTEMGSVMGTPAYMSPEQALGEVDRLDERTDVFGLAAILCEILTGKPPYVANNGELVFRLASRGKLEDCYARLDACHVDTELKQIVLDGLALEPDDRLRDAGQLASRFSGYLESVETRLRKAEVDRATEAARAEEALKTAAQELVSRKEAQGRMLEELRRRRVTMALAASLLIGLIGVGWFAMNAREEQKRAEIARQAALSAQLDAEKSQQSEVLQRKEVETARESEASQRVLAETERDNAKALSEALVIEKQELSRQKEVQRRMLYTSDMNLIQIAWDADNVSKVLDLLNAHRPRPGQTDLRGFEWHYWNRLCHSELQSIKQTDQILDGVLSPDGQKLAMVPSVKGSFRNQDSQTLNVRDIKSNLVTHSLKLEAVPSSFVSYSWRPDGNRLAVVVDAPDGAMKLSVWDLASDKLLFTKTEQSNAQVENAFIPRSDPWFSADGNRVAMPVGLKEDSQLRVVKFWDSETGEELSTVPLPCKKVYNLSISSDGSRIVFGTVENENDGFDFVDAIKVLHVSSPEQHITISLPGQSSFALSPDGRTFIVSGSMQTSPTATREDKSGVYDATTGKRLYALPDKEPWMRHQISPDGKWLAVTLRSRHRTVKMYRITEEQSPTEFRGHNELVTEISFSQDSRRLFTRDTQDCIKTWDVAALPPPSPVRTKPTIVMPQVVAVSNDGTQIAKAPGRSPISRNLNLQTIDDREKVITLHDQYGNIKSKSKELVGPIRWLKFSANGKYVAACAVSLIGDLQTAAQLTVWDTKSGELKLEVRAAANEARTFVNGNSNTIREVTAPEFAPDGNHIAMVIPTVSASSTSSHVRIWKIGEVDYVSECESVPYALDGVRYSPNGDRIVGVPSPRYDGLLTVWDAESKKVLWKRINFDPVTGVKFSADGARMLGCVSRTLITLWDTDSGREILTFLELELRNFSTILALSSDGRRLATTTKLARAIKVWDVDRPERELFTLNNVATGIQGIAFSPDNLRIVTFAGSGSVLSAPDQNLDGGETKLWDAETGQELLTLPGAGRDGHFNADGTLLIGELGNYVSGDIRVQHWDASPLSPQVEANQLVEVLSSRRGAEPLPILSEILAGIDADETLSDETRATAVALANNLHREKKLNQSAWEIASQPNRAREQYQRALNYMEEACKSAPENRESWSTHGLVQVRMGLFSEAIATMAHVQKLQASNSHAMTAEDMTILAMAHIKIGKVEDARETLNSIQSHASRNEVEWKKLLSEAESMIGVATAADQPAHWIGRKFMPRKGVVPKNEEGQLVSTRQPYFVTKVVGDRLYFGAHFVHRSQVVPIEEASKYYTNMLQLEGDTGDRLFAFNGRGIASRVIGEYDQAIADYTAAIELVPVASIHFNNRGLVWQHDKKDLDKALADFDKAVNLLPNDAWNQATRGLVLFEKGRLDEATVCLDEAIRLKPNDGWAYAKRADVWSAKGDSDKMTKDLEEAIRLSPDDPSTLGSRAWLMAASPIKEHRNGKQALADATKACVLTLWREPGYLARLAAAYAEIGDFEQAIKWQKEALALLPSAARAEEESRLNLYLKSEPFREPPKTANSMDIDVR